MPVMCSSIHHRPFQQFGFYVKKKPALMYLTKKMRKPFHLCHHSLATCPRQSLQATPRKALCHSFSLLCTSTLDEMDCAPQDTYFFLLTVKET